MAMVRRPGLRRRVLGVAFVLGALLPIGLRRRLMFVVAHRRFPRLNHPRTFNEKVNWRIIHDRSARLEWTCDKLAMKDHGLALAPGAKTARTFWSGTDVRDLASVDLPHRWVLKANHRSGLYHLVDGPLDVEELRRLTTGWLGSKQGRLMGEWAYTRARPLIVAEERLGDDEPPSDYKFYVFDGTVRYVDKHNSRIRAHASRFYTADWTPLDVQVKGYPLAAVEPEPEHLAEMLEIASQVGRPFDFMRVDLYDLPDGVYLGETTPYPGSGLESYAPVEFDVEIGAHWTLGARR